MWHKRFLGLKELEKLRRVRWKEIMWIKDDCSRGRNDMTQDSKQVFPVKLRFHPFRLNSVRLLRVNAGLLKRLSKVKWNQT